MISIASFLDAPDLEAGRNAAISAFHGGFNAEAGENLRSV